MHVAYARHVWESESERCESRHEEKAGLFVLRQRYYSFGLLLPCARSPALSASLTHSLTCSRSFLVRSFALSAVAVCACAYLCVLQWWCVWVSERTNARSLSLSLADFNGRSEVFIVGTQYSQVAFLMPSAKPAPFFTQTQTLSLTHTHTLRDTDSVAFLCSQLVGFVFVRLFSCCCYRCCCCRCTFLLAFLGSSWKTAPQLAARLCVFSKTFSPSSSSSSVRTLSPLRGLHLHHTKVGKKSCFKNCLWPQTLALFIFQGKPGENSAPSSPLINSFIYF